MTKKEKEEIEFQNYQHLLKVYTLGILMLEQCDRVVDSNKLAVRELKMQTKRYVRFLEKNIDRPVRALYQTDEDIFQMLQEAYSVVLSINMEDIPTIAQKYLDNKNKKP